MRWNAGLLVLLRVYCSLMTEEASWSSGKGSPTHNCIRYRVDDTTVFTGPKLQDALKWHAIPSSRAYLHGTSQLEVLPFQAFTLNNQWYMVDDMRTR